MRQGCLLSASCEAKQTHAAMVIFAQMGHLFEEQRTAIRR